MVAGNMVGRGLSKVSSSSRKCHKHKTLHITHNHTNTPVCIHIQKSTSIRDPENMHLTIICNVLEHGHKHKAIHITHNSTIAKSKIQQNVQRKAQKSGRRMLLHTHGFLDLTQMHFAYQGTQTYPISMDLQTNETSV